MKHRVISHLNRVADANGDEFQFGFRIERNGTSVSYCEERAEGHTFISATGANPGDAIGKITEDDIDSACEAWGYKYVA